jgi:hypothetical protein
MKKFLIAFVVIVIVLFSGLYFSSQTVHAPKTTNTTMNPQTALLIDVAVWYPSAPWTTPKATSEQTQYGDLSGESMSATVTSQTAMLPHFEQQQTLKAKGFMPDMMLAADGPGSSMWGYKKDDGATSQILTFSYKTQPTSSNPNEPLQFNCPCKLDISVFSSSPFTPK